MDWSRLTINLSTFYINGIESLSPLVILVHLYIKSV